MEKVIILAISAAVVALLGRNRKIGYGWSFVLCFLFTPVIGIILILTSKKVEPADSIDSADSQGDTDTMDTLDTMEPVNQKKKVDKTKEE
ncbi:MAG: hypothetical protein ACYC1Q_12710 [Bacteroidia bacterium]